MKSNPLHTYRCECKMRILDLFCGAGGAAMGLHRAFPEAEITGVDIKPQKNYPFTFIQADALEFPLEGYDFIWASPPCQAYVDHNRNKESNHPRLIEPIRKKLIRMCSFYIIENVELAPLFVSLKLCGTMFGLRVIRHRIFECNFPMPLVASCNHWGEVADGDFIGVYAMGGKGHRRGKGIRDPHPLEIKISPQEAMGIDWMTKQELTQAVPPAYSEFIGRQLRMQMERKRAAI